MHATATNHDRSVRWLRLAALIYLAALAVATHWPHLTLPGDGEIRVMQIDKIGHVVLFGVLAWLLMLARPLGTHRPWTLNALAGAAIAFLYAPLDEWTQQWFARQASMADIVASWTGILCVYMLASLPTHRAGDRDNPLSRWLALGGWATLMLALIVLTCLPMGQQSLIDLIPQADERAAMLPWMRRVAILLATLLLWHARVLGGGHLRLNAVLTLLVMGLAGPILETIRAQATGTPLQPGMVLQMQEGFLLACLLLAGLTAWRYVRAPHLVQAPMTLSDAPATAHAPGTDHATPGFVQAANLMALLTGVSRIAGLVRDATLAWAFGLTGVADAFAIGFQIPNLFRRLFGEGALSASLVPVYTRLHKLEPSTARRFVGVCIGLSAVGLLGLALLLELVLLVIWLNFPLEGKLGWALELTLWMLPYMPMVCLVALLSGVLHVHRRFGAPAAAPVILNIAMIAGVLLTRLWVGPASETDTQLWQMQIARGVALAVVLAGLVQLAWMGVLVWRLARPAFAFEGTGRPLREMAVMLGPMLLGLGIFQINAFLDSLLAFGLSPMQDGDPDAKLHLLGYVLDYPVEIGGAAALQWAQRLYQFPLGVFGIAIATAVFPALAAAVVERSRPDHVPGQDPFIATLRQGLRLSLYIALPASLGLIVLREPITQLVYQRGQFDAADTMRVAAVLGFYSAGIWAYSLMHVLTRAFFAMQDSRTPMWISLRVVGLNFALNLLLIWPMGIRGLALSTAICATVQMIWLLRTLARTSHEPIMTRDVWTSWLRIAVLSGVMATVVMLATSPLDIAAMGFVLTLLTTLGLCAIGVVVYLLGSWVWELEELGWLLHRGPRQRR